MGYNYCVEYTHNNKRETEIMALSELALLVGFSGYNGCYDFDIWRMIPGEGMYKMYYYKHDGIFE